MSRNKKNSVVGHANQQRHSVKQYAPVEYHIVTHLNCAIVTKEGYTKTANVNKKHQCSLENKFA